MKKFKIKLKLSKAELILSNFDVYMDYSLSFDIKLETDLYTIKFSLGQILDNEIDDFCNRTIQTLKDSQSSKDEKSLTLHTNSVDIMLEKTCYEHKQTINISLPIETDNDRENIEDFLIELRSVAEIVLGI